MTLEELRELVGKNALSLNAYQKLAMETCLPTCRNDTYGLTLLISEVGEYADKVGKWRRKSEAFIKDDHIVFNTSDPEVAHEYKLELIKELGDVLWAVAENAELLGFTLEEVARINLFKLANRKVTNQIITHKDH